MIKNQIIGLISLGLVPLASHGATFRFDLNVSDFAGFSETARYTLEVQEWDAPIIDNTGTPISQWSFPVDSGSVDFAGETTVFSPADLTNSVFEVTVNNPGSLVIVNDNIPLPDAVFGSKFITGGRVSVFNEIFTEGVSVIPVERNSNDLRYLDANEFPDNRGTFLHMIKDSSGTFQEDLFVEISNVSIPEPSAFFLISLAGSSFVLRRHRRG